MRADDSEHPDSAAFSRLALGTASPEETRQVVRHLLRGCAVCSRRAEEARSVTPPPPSSYDEVFDRLERRLAQGLDRLEKDRREPATAEQLYAELLAHEAVQGLAQLHSTRRYASLALCELLLQTARKLGIEDPPRARRATELAVRVAEQLDLDLYGAPVVQDLRAIAWAYLADTGRVQADLRLAESSLAIAERLLEEGTGDPLVRAELMTVKASLCAYGGRFDRAIQLLNRTATIYRRLRDRHLLGRTLVKKGTFYGNAGDPEIAIRLIRRGIDLIDAQREPRLMVCAIHNLVWFFQESGRTGQGATWLAGARRIYQKAGDRQDLGRLRWLEGKIAGQPREAESALLAAREALAKEGLAYEAALAAMDLAVLYASERRGTEMRRQTDQMLPLFRSGDMYRETLMALSSFDPSTRRNPAALLDELGGFLDRAWQKSNPQALAPPV